MLLFFCLCLPTSPLSPFTPPPPPPFHPSEAFHPPPTSFYPSEAFHSPPPPLSQALQPFPWSQSSICTQGTQSWTEPHQNITRMQRTCLLWMISTQNISSVTRFLCIHKKVHIYHPKIYRKQYENYVCDSQDTRLVRSLERRWRQPFPQQEFSLERWFLSCHPVHLSLQENKYKKTLIKTSYLGYYTPTPPPSPVPQQFLSLHRCFGDNLQHPHLSR